MLQSLGNSNANLCRETLAAREHRCANDRREPGIDEDLTAHDREDAVGFRVSLRFVHTVEVAASHISLR